MKLFRAVIRSLFSMLLVYGSPAGAALVTYSGTFTANYSTPPLTQGIPTLTGDWEFSFDDGTLTGSGFENFEVSLAALTLTPGTIGTTAFTTANTGAAIYFEDGVLTDFAVGGLPEGYGMASGSFDDFYMHYVVAYPYPSDSCISLGSINSVDCALSDGSLGSITLSYTVSTVPLPAAAWLFGSGMLGLFGLSRRRKAA